MIGSICGLRSPVAVAVSVLACLLAAVPAEARKLCSISGCSDMAGTLQSEIKRQLNQQSFGYEHETVAAISEEILQVAGLRPNFVLIRTSDVPNAAAVIVDADDGSKVRVLAYNPGFFDEFVQDRKWWIYGIMAHEIGHHVQGHTLLPGGSKPPTELEADEYAGFILAGLGASRDKSLELWKEFPPQGSSTHPGREDRLAAVGTGWERWTSRYGQRETPEAARETAEFLFPDSDRRELAFAELAGLSPAQLRIGRNEIFARHGYAFDSPDLQAHFGRFSWYRPRGKSVALSSVEKANVELFQAAEGRGSVRAAAEFIFPDSSRRRLRRDEVARLPKGQLRIARNEIFARHGYIFNARELADYFGRKSWYQPLSSSVRLTPLENANVQLIRSFE
ncbi:MAG: YARHG domain-containing protein [Hyphomicrobiaceae bacterium]|nr:YARHG domain-containing protein [Hyphomicrobiaceae bacterium]